MDQMGNMRNEEILGFQTRTIRKSRFLRVFISACSESLSNTMCWETFLKVGAFDEEPPLHLDQIHSLPIVFRVSRPKLERIQRTFSESLMLRQSDNIIVAREMVRCSRIESHGIVYDIRIVGKSTARIGNERHNRGFERFKGSRQHPPL